MFKIMFKIIRWIILILLVLFLFSFPILVFNENPFTFYWDSLKTILELFKESNPIETIWDLIKSKF
ncbi:hypothetical protein LCGC14_0996530 [marine sediment metagenome]|uniref:Uncharacterized protein n=1 Tax=marine sediment metagenome TaxID=412755 RepID=A0A0F9RAI3_9ZZZZ